MAGLTFSAQLLKIKAKRLWYLTEFYDKLTYILSELNRETTDFIWGNKKHGFNQDILMTNTGNGGQILV